MKRLLLIIPLGLFVIVALFAVRGLSLDQQNLPSVLIDKPAPDLELANMPGLGNAFTTEELKGQVTLVNIFGSWCPSCRLEHSLLMQIGAEDEVPLYGINWIDTPERGADWLAQWGNPYDKVGNDAAGRNIIQFGVTAAPETFLIDQEGRIRYRHAGPLTPDFWEKTLRPMVLELQKRDRPES